MTFREFCESKGFKLSTVDERFICAAAKTCPTTFNPRTVADNGRRELFLMYNRYRLRGV